MQKKFVVKNFNTKKYFSGYAFWKYHLWEEDPKFAHLYDSIEYAETFIENEEGERLQIEIVYLT
jgi:hypothetical protein